MTSEFEALKGKIIVHSYGEKNGGQTFRVNGLKEDLESLVNSLLSIGVKFKQTPVIEQTYPRSLYTVLLEINVHDK